MLGGEHNKGVVANSELELAQIAMNALRNHVGIIHSPSATLVSVHRSAIPQ